MIELIPESYVAPLDFPTIFGRDAPLHVDLGCGDGSFLFALAESMPGKNFFGIDRLFRRIRTAARKAQKIDNLRVLRLESSYAVRYLLPPRSVERFYLLFPDPWPKRKHQRRRIMTKDFLAAIGHALLSNGTLRIATDQADYFDWMFRLAEQSRDFDVKKINCEDCFPLSTFEKKFKREGAKIYRLELRKISPLI